MSGLCADLDDLWLCVPRQTIRATGIPVRTPQSTVAPECISRPNYRNSFSQNAKGGCIVSRLDVKEFCSCRRDKNEEHGSSFRQPTRSSTESPRLGQPSEKHDRDRFSRA